MTDEPATKLSIRDRIKWWLYERCFAYCVRCAHPDANPAEFCLLDMENFVAVNRDEVREIVKEAPDLAWRFREICEHYDAEVALRSGLITLAR